MAKQAVASIRVSRPAAPNPADELAAIALAIVAQSERRDSFDRQCEELTIERRSMAADVALGRANADDLAALNARLRELDDERIAAIDAIGELERRADDARQAISDGERAEKVARLTVLDRETVEARRRLQDAVQGVAPLVDAAVAAERAAYGLALELKQPRQYRAKRDIGRYIRATLSTLHPHIGENVRADLRLPLVPDTDQEVTHDSR